VTRNYADSHPVLKVSAKRFAASPFVDRYATDETVFGVYGGRLYPLSNGDDPIEGYWRLRREAALFDVPERPLQIEGPDSERFLDLVLTRTVGALGLGRASYGIACDAYGGILMDGVLLRLSPERFWYVLADGDIAGWLQAHAAGFDVSITDPGSWVLQIQGPTSLTVLADAVDEPLPDPFAYFAVTEARMGDQPVLVSRTGWSGELGFEVYTFPGVEGPALWDHLLLAGEPHGLRPQSLGPLGIRRIEAGILDNGTDMDASMTPYAVGLGRFVDLTKEHFIGRDALAEADRRPRLFGLSGASVPIPGTPVRHNGEVVGKVTAGAWSPFLQRGVGYAVMDHADAWPGRTVNLGDSPDPAELGELPFYDPGRLIPRGATA
jgi:glycine cleavage system aminomethyltransferase T